MERNFDVDDREQIAQIRAAWQAYDTTGDGTAIANHLAEEIVLMPPGAPPLTGKAAVLRGEGAGRDYEVERTSTALYVSDGLAVDQITVTGPPNSGRGGVSDDVSLKGVDVYRRDATGAWECIISIWNNQA